MGKKSTPQANKRYTAEFKSEALKLAERLSVAEAAEKEPRSCFRISIDECVRRVWYELGERTGKQTSIGILVGVSGWVKFRFVREELGFSNTSAGE